VQRRFLQEDPLAGSASPYAYVNGSPLEATDPSGMIMDWGMSAQDPRNPCNRAGCHGPASWLGFDDLPIQLSDAEMMRIAAFDAGGGYNAYVANFKNHAATHDSVYDQLTECGGCALFQGAHPMSRQEYSKAVAGLEWAQYHADPTDPNYALIGRAQSRVQDGKVFINLTYIEKVERAQHTSYLITGNTPLAGDFSALDPYAIDYNSKQCAANLVIHETMHAGIGGGYGTGDEPQIRQVAGKLSGCQQVHGYMRR
jgi:hypothetical protein